MSAKLVLIRKLAEFEAAVADRRLEAARVDLRSLVASLFGAENLGEIQLLLIEISKLASESGMKSLMVGWELDEMKKFLVVARQSAIRLYG